MKKKFLSLMLVLIVCMSVFTGCNLVTRNDKNYYNQTVATITYVDGDKDTVSKQELITAFNSYGYNYVQNYGYTNEKAIETTLETIINKRITIKAVEKYYTDKNEKVLNENETAYLWDETLKAVYSNLKSYFYEVIDYKEPEAQEEASADKSIYQEYQSTVEIIEIDGKLVIKKKAPATTIRETYEARKVGDSFVDYEFKDAQDKQIFKEAMYQDILNLAKDSTDSERDKQWKNAFTNYVKAIKDNYSYKDFTEDKQWFEFELDRVYNIMKDNYMVEKYEAIYNTQKHHNASISGVSVEDVLKLYTAKVKTDYAAYTAIGGKDTFESAMFSDIANVDYILETKDLTDDVASNFFSVGYIKLNLDTDLKNELTQLEARKGEYSRIEDYNAAVDAIYKKVYTNVRNATTGAKTDEKAYAYDTEKGKGLLTKISEELSGATDKSTAFRKYLYLYNDDDTLKGATNNTVFGINANNEVLTNDTFKDNEAVKTAIKDLYAKGKGNLSEIVRADDGVYIFFYAEDIENLFVVNSSFDASKNQNNIYALTKAKLNSFSEKTIFDSLFESLDSDKFSVYQNMDINNLRQELTEGDISIDKKAIKKL